MNSLPESLSESKTVGSRTCGLPDRHHTHKQGCQTYPNVSYPRVSYPAFLKGVRCVGLWLCYVSVRRGVSVKLGLQSGIESMRDAQGTRRLDTERLGYEMSGSSKTRS